MPDKPWFSASGDHKSLGAKFTSGDGEMANRLEIESILFLFRRKTRQP